MPSSVKIKTRISLTVYGWPGWSIGPYGKSKQWKLFSPAGEPFAPSEIEAIRGYILDNDFLKARISALSGALAHPAMSRRLDNLRLLAGILGSLAGVLGEPAALLGDPIDFSRLASRRLPDLKGNLALADQLIQELRAVGILDVPDRPKR